MIRSNFAILRTLKEQRDGRKWPYREIAAETKLSMGVLTRVMNNEFDRIEVATLDALCKFFNCGVGDLLIYTAGQKDEGDMLERISDYLDTRKPPNVPTRDLIAWLEQPGHVKGLLPIAMQSRKTGLVDSLVEAIDERLLGFDIPGLEEKPAQHMIQWGHIKKFLSSREL